MNNKVQSQKVELSVPDWLEVIIRPNTAPHFKTKLALTLDGYKEEKEVAEEESESEKELELEQNLDRDPTLTLTMSLNTLGLIKLVPSKQINIRKLSNRRL